MPNDYCNFFGSAHATADSDMGAGNSDTAFDSATDTYQSVNDAIDALNRARAAHQRVADSIVDELKNNVFDGKELTAGEEKILAGAAHRLIKDLHPTLERGVEDAFDFAERVWNVVSGASLGHATAWLNMKNKIYAYLATSTAQMHKWIGLMADTGEGALYKNRLVRAFEDSHAKTNAMANKFVKRNKAFLKAVRSEARAVGLKPDEFMTLLGRYAVGRHIELEGNANLLRKYRADVENFRREHGQNVASMSEIERNEYQRELDRLTVKAETLAMYIDTPLSEVPIEDQGNLFTVGYTNADARDIQSEMLRKMGITAERADELSSRLSDEFYNVLRERIEAGMIGPELLNSFPEMMMYIPTTARASLHASNLTGIPNDTGIFNPGTFHERQGRVGLEPDNAWATLQLYQRRAAMEIGNRDFGEILNSMFESLPRRGVDADGETKSRAGLNRWRYDDVMRWRHAEDPNVRDMADQIMRRGGLVVRVVDRAARAANPEAAPKYEKYIFSFDSRDFELNGATYSGEQLNRALSGTFHSSDISAPLRVLGKGSALMGSLYTRLSPLFSPVAGTRDFMERMLNVVNREYVMPDGAVLQGVNVLPHMIANIASSGDIFLQGVRGTLDPNSRAGQLYRAYVDNGVEQSFTSRYRSPDTTLFEELNPEKSHPFLSRIGMDKPEYRKLFAEAGDKASDVMETLDNWNNYFQNVAAFNHFRTLAELGCDIREAASGARIEMNLGQRGILAPEMAALAPFHAPSVQSGLAMLRSLGLGADRIEDIPKQGWKGAAALLGAYGAYTILQELARDSLGYDEDGMSRYDALTADEKTRFLPIGFGDEGEYFKFPIGFGLPQLGAFLAVATDMVQKGTMTPADMMMEAVYLGIKTNSPGGWPDYLPTEHPFESVMYLFTPQMFKPLVEAASNMNFMGAPIYSEPWNDTTPRSEMGYGTTPRPYHRLAKLLREMTGMDYQPEFYRHILRQYMAGPFKFITSMVQQLDDLYVNSERQSVANTMDPVLAALGMTYMYGNVPNPGMSMYNEAKRYFEGRIRDAGIPMTGEGSDKDAEGFRRRSLAEAGWSDDDIDDYIAIYQAERRLMSLGTNFSNTWKKDWAAMDSSADMYAHLKEYADAKTEVYNNFVRNSRYYQ